MDRRRRQWIAWDVYFNDGALGTGIRQRFGVCGITVFTSFLSACKKSSVQGQMTYGNDTEALAILALPGLRLVNEQGEEWTLDDFWTYLGQRKQIRRRRRGRITDVISTRWEQWQNTPGGKKTGRSEARNTGELETNTGDDNDIDNDPDIDPDLESDNDPDTPPTSTNQPRPAAPLEGGGSSTSEGQGKTEGLVRMLAAACTAENRKRVEIEAVLVIGLCKPHAPTAVLEAAVLSTVRAKEPPVLPRAVIKSFQRECRKRGLPAPLIDEAQITGKRAS